MMRRWCGAAVAASMILVSSVGCEQADWSDPQYVMQALEEGDATQVRIALENFGNLEEKQKVEAIPALVAVYKEGGSNAKKAMQQLVQMPDAKAQEAFVAEMKSDETGWAPAAAEALGEAKLRDAIPAMVETLEKTDDREIKQAIVRGMAQMPDPRMVDPLTKVLQLDSDNYPFPMFAYACETLGEIGQTKPDAFDEEAASTLVRAVFLTNNKGQNVEMECGLAVQQLGEPAVPHLIEVFKGEHEGVQKLMMAYRRPLNGAKALAVQRLMTLRAESALPALIADLRAEKAAPEEINKTDAAVEWRESEVRALNDTLFAVGEIGGEGAREILVEVLTGERNEDWDDITDAMVELVVRQNAARALKRLGDPEALDAIMEMAAKGVIIPWERRSAMLERRGEPAPPKVRYQFNWMSAKQYAILAPASRIGDYNELLSSTKIEPLKKLFGRFIPALELAKVCDTKGSPAEQAKCYGDSLEDKDVVVRERAAFSLGRLPAEAAGPILVEHLGTERIDTREFIELAIYETAPKSAIAKIDELLENEQDAVDNVYKRDHRRLRLLRAWLKNNAE